MVVFNNELDTIDIRNQNYEGYLMWGKTNCGNDFLRGLEDGRVKYYIIDYEAYYEHTLTPYYRSDKSLSGTIIQYKQTSHGAQGKIKKETNVYTL